MADQIELCLERYKEITRLIEGDSDATDLLEDLTSSAMRYVRNVAYERSVVIPARNGDGDGDIGSTKRRVENADFQRRASHEALISGLNSFNRYLFSKKKNVPKGGIYTLDPLTIDDRFKVGDWAWDYVRALTRLNSGE